MAEQDATKGDGRGLSGVRRFDLVVVGAGAAGLSVTYAAARLGVRAMLVERGPMGGECLNAGCVPSKAMLAAARRGLDWNGVRGEIRRAVGAIAPLDSVRRYEGLGAVVVKGEARFAGPDVLEVNGERVQARWIVLATGSRPAVPAFMAGMPYVTNESVWTLAERPPRLVIVGGGPMAMEMADAFCAMGSQVCVVAGGRVLAREDAALAAVVAGALRARGVEILEQRAVGMAGDGRVALADGRVVEGDVVLVAAGRMVDAAGLNLGVAGLMAGPGGIRTDRGLRAVGNKRVFVVGDAAAVEGVGAQRFTHVAGAHAGVVVRRMFFRLPARVSGVAPVRAIYTAPELAQVGATLAEAQVGARGLVWPFAENDRALAEGDIVGMVKVVVDRKGRIVGAGIVGAGAGEMIGMYAVMVARKMRVSMLAGLVLPYPTRSEAGKRAAGAYFAERIFSERVRGIVRLLGRLP